MSPVAELEPVAKYLNKKVVSIAADTPPETVEQYISFVCELYDDVGRTEKETLDAGIRTQEFFDEVEALYQSMQRMLIAAQNCSQWVSVRLAVRDRADSCMMDLQDDLQRYRRGHRGRERLAEYFRDEL